MKRLDLDKILNREPGKLTEPHYEHKKPRVNIKQSTIQCSCGKIGYLTPQDAESASALIRKKHKGFSRWYKCSICKQYHLTTSPEDSRREKKSKAKK